MRGTTDQDREKERKIKRDRQTERVKKIDTQRDR